MGAADINIRSLEAHEDRQSFHGLLANTCRQIRPAALPPQCLSVRHRLSVYLERGGGMEAGNHHQADPPRHPGPAQRPKSGVSGPG